MPNMVRELHDRYGDVVRIGPNELSIRSSEAVELILGSKGKMNKGPWCVLYSFSLGFIRPCSPQTIGTILYSPTRVATLCMH